MSDADVRRLAACLLLAGANALRTGESWTVQHDRDGHIHIYHDSALAEGLGLEIAL